MALDIFAWHDRTAADHKAQIDTGGAAGYRTIALSVYGDRGDPRYAAAMVKRSTVVGEQQFFALDTGGLQAKWDEMAARGWGPEIISATGPAGDPLIAACFVEMPLPLARIGLTQPEFSVLNQQQMDAGNILRWADVYGMPGDLRYLGIWVRNEDARAWCVGVDDDPAATQARFDALVAGFARPIHIVPTPEGRFLVVYDDSTAGLWEARDGMSSADYQQRFDALYPQGLRPVCVGGVRLRGVSSFSAIFATREDRDPRTLRMSGAPAIAAIDGAMVAMMRANMVRGASLAVVADTRLVYARGYTLAEPGYPDVQPTTLFRQASVAKMFTAAAIHTLVSTGATVSGVGPFALDTLLVDALPAIVTSATPAAWDQITVRHLLEMTSGITTSVLGTDAQLSGTLPVTALEMARWVARHSLANTPGDTTKGTYSNAAYMILGLIAARLCGAPTFLDAIRPLLLDPLRITRVRSSVSAATAQHPDEARYHSRPLATAPSVVVPAGPLCPLGYGEWNLENLGGGGGLSAAVTDIARMVAALSVTTGNPMMPDAALRGWLNAAADATAAITGSDAHGYHGFDEVAVADPAGHTFRGMKGGDLTTSQNGVIFVTGGVSVVMCWNGKTPNTVNGKGWLSWDAPVLLAAEAQAWGTGDLFPSFGMPSLVAGGRRRPVPRP